MEEKQAVNKKKKNGGKGTFFSLLAFFKLQIFYTYTSVVTGMDLMPFFFRLLVRF